MRWIESQRSFRNAAGGITKQCNWQLQIKLWTLSCVWIALLTTKMSALMVRNKICSSGDSVAGKWLLQNSCKKIKKQITR